MEIITFGRTPYPGKRCQQSWDLVSAWSVGCIFNCFFFPIRNDKPGGHQESGQVVPDATPGKLSRRTLRCDDDVLEAEARGTAHFWVPADNPQWFLYRHGGTVWDAALRETEEAPYRKCKGITDADWIIFKWTIFKSWEDWENVKYWRLFLSLPVLMELFMLSIWHFLREHFHHGAAQASDTAVTLFASLFDAILVHKV